MLDRHDRIHAQSPTAVWSSSAVDTVAPVTITNPPVKRAWNLCEGVRTTDGVDRMDERRTQHTRLTRARIYDRLVTSTRTSYVTRMNWHSPQQDPTCTAATQRSSSFGPIAHHVIIDRDGHPQAHCAARRLSAPTASPPDCAPDQQSRPTPVKGTPPNEPASCITRANAGSRIATNVAAFHLRQSVHSPPTSKVKRQLSDPPTPSSHSDGT